MLSLSRSVWQHQYPRLAGLLAVLIAGMTLTGWALNVDVLRTVRPGLPSMMPNTAVGLAASGLALILLALRGTSIPRRVGGSLCALLAMMIGSLTLSQYLFGWDLGIDTVLFHDAVTAMASAAFPGRPAPNTSLTFVLVGAGLLLLGPEKCRTRGGAQVAALAAAVIPLASVVGYLYGTQSLYGPPGLLPYIGMAVHTAATFLLLSTGILATELDCGPMALIISPGIGGTLVRRMVPATLVIMVAGGGLTMAGLEAGFYDVPTGIALMVVGSVVVLGLQVGLIATSLDRVERARRQAEALYRNLLEAAPDAILAVDQQGRITVANTQAEQVLGYRHDELVGQPVEMLIPAPWRDQHAALRQQYAHTPGTRPMGAGLDLIARRRDGSEIPVEISLSSMETDCGPLVTAIIRDVTQRRRAEEALRASEARFRELIEQASDGIFIADLDGQYTDVNSAGCQMLGYSREEIVGKTIVDLIPPEEVGRLWQEKEHLLNGKIQVTEWTLRRKDGTYLPVEVSAKILPGGQWQGFVRDITGRRWLEEERTRLLAQVQQERNWLETVIERSPVGIALVHDVTSDRVVLNRRGAELFGRTAVWEAGIQQYAEQVLRTDGTPCPFEELTIARALRGEIDKGTERLLLRPDGTTVPAVAYGGPIWDADGQIVGAVVVFEDITSAKELERLREEWTAVIAHDLRQPVTAIVGYAGMLARAARQREAPPREQEQCQHILASARQLDRMIADLLDMSRLEAHQLTLCLQEIDLPGTVQAVADRAATATQGHEVVLEIEDGLPAVKADPMRLEQVLDNLLSNAAKYGTPGSPIVVQVGQCGPAAQVAVINQGAGIPADELPQLFTRFGRTAAATGGKVAGIGLGLYITKGLVEAHGGRIWAESTPGVTTAFRFTLPLAQPAAARPTGTAA